MSTQTEQSSYTILYDRPLPELSWSINKFYAVRDETNNDISDDVYALVSPLDKEPRFDDLPVFLKTKIPHLQKVLDFSFSNLFENHALVKTPRLGNFVFEKMRGITLERFLEEEIYDVNVLVSQFLHQSCTFLTALHDACLTYRRFGLNSIYVTQNEGGYDFTFIECLSAPAGSISDPFFEPVESLFCDISCRSDKDPRADWYSLGGVLFCMLFKKHPPFIKSSKELLYKKITKGSFDFFKDKFGPFEEDKSRWILLLKGLLEDNLSLRWGKKEVDQWLKNDKRTLKYHSKRKYCVQQTNGVYNSLEHLALDFRLDPVFCEQVIQKHSFWQWFLEVSSDKDRVDKFQESMKNDLNEVHVLKSNYQLLYDLMDNAGVISLQRFSFSIPSLANAIELFFKEEKEITDLSREILTEEFWDLYFHCEKNYLLPNALEHKKDTIKRWAMRQGYFGYGLERCLYTLKPHTQCHSRSLPTKVYTAYELVQTLEWLSKRNMHALLIDNHMICFLLERTKGVSSVLLHALGSKETQVANLAVLELFAWLQEIYNFTTLPGLAAVLFNLNKALINKIVYKTTAETFFPQVEQAVKAGDLIALHKHLSDAQLFRHEALMHMNDKLIVSTLERNIQENLDRLQNAGNYLTLMSQKSAVMVSFVLGVMLTMGVLYLHFVTFH